MLTSWDGLPLGTVDNSQPTCWIITMASTLIGLSHGAVSRGIRYGQPAEQRLVLNHSDLFLWFTLSISLWVSFLIPFMVPFRVTLMMVPLVLIMVPLSLIVISLVLLMVPLVLMVVPITFLMVSIVLLMICMVFLGATVGLLMVSNVKVRVGFFFLFLVLSLPSICSGVEFFLHLLRLLGETAHVEGVCHQSLATLQVGTKHKWMTLHPGDKGKSLRCNLKGRT